MLRRSHPIKKVSKKRYSMVLASDSDNDDDNHDDSSAVFIQLDR